MHSMPRTRVLAVTKLGVNGLKDPSGPDSAGRSVCRFPWRRPSNDLGLRSSVVHYEFFPPCFDHRDPHICPMEMKGRVFPGKCGPGRKRGRPLSSGQGGRDLGRGRKKKGENPVVRKSRLFSDQLRNQMKSLTCLPRKDMRTRTASV